MSFQPASQAIPDVLGAMLLIRRRIRENPAMTQRMYDAICQLLEHIYLLPIQESRDDGPYDFIVPNEGIYERMNTRLRRVERWVVQWPHRQMIDYAFEHFRLVYRELLMRVSNFQGEERHNRAQDYVDELEEFGFDSEDDEDDETSETDSVVTPPRQPNQPQRAQRLNRD